MTFRRCCAQQEVNECWSNRHWTEFRETGRDENMVVHHKSLLISRYICMYTVAVGNCLTQAWSLAFVKPTQVRVGRAGIMHTLAAALVNPIWVYFHEKQFYFWDKNLISSNCCCVPCNRKPRLGKYLWNLPKINCARRVKRNY
jgi:hypothetical protein